MTTYSGYDFWREHEPPWPVVPLRKVARLGTGHTPSRSVEEYWVNCTIPWVTTEDLTSRAGTGLEPLLQTNQQISELGLANSAAELHPAGTVMLSRTASVGHVARVGVPMATTQAFVTWTCGPDLDPRYLTAVLVAMNPEFFRLAYGSTHLTIYMPDIEQLRVPVPPLAAQRAIADFLDTETARIDALIAKKRRLGRLLEDRFGSYVRERLSSVGPTLPLKRRWTVVDCKHRTPTYVEAGYPVVSPGDVTAGRLDLSRAHRFVDDADYRDLADLSRRPGRGDIIYSRNASIGIAAYVDTDQPFCMGQDVCLVTSRDQSQLYLSYVLNSVGLDQLDRQKIGSTFSRINVAQILEIKVPTPDLLTQEALAGEFEAVRAQSDRLLGALERQIGVLTERRQALITAAVTGELDIPGVAA